MALSPSGLTGDLQTVVAALQQLSVQLGNLIQQISKSAPPANIAGLLNAANDGAAATGGVPVGGMYRNGSVLMVRVT
jgi:hypothetical protein